MKDGADVDWSQLWQMNVTELEALGLHRWNARGEEWASSVLMLIPHDWYDDIPGGFMLAGIQGSVHAHVPYPRDEDGKVDWNAVAEAKKMRGVTFTDTDHRFGFLAYGVSVNRPHLKTYTCECCAAEVVHDTKGLPRDLTCPNKWMMFRRLKGEFDEDEDAFVQQIVSVAWFCPVCVTEESLLLWLEKEREDTPADTERVDFDDTGLIAFGDEMTPSQVRSAIRHWANWRLRD